MTNTKTDASLANKIRHASLEKQENQALQRAIDYLGAVEVAPRRYAERGSLGLIQVEPARYSFQFGSHGRWWNASEATIALWWEKRDPSVDGCPFCVLMPQWWNPMRRFAFQANDGTVFTDAEKALDFDGAAYAITADLTTGAEVPA